VPCRKRGAESATGIACRGLNPNVIEEVRSRQKAIGDAVQGDAPC